MKEDLEEFLTNWVDSIRTGQKVHYRNARVLKTCHIWLGSAVVVLSSIAGASIFSTLEDNPSFPWRVAAGVISLTAGVLAALQGFLNLSKKSDEHLQIAKSLTTLKREIEAAIQVKTTAELVEYVDTAREQWKESILNAPIVGERVFQQMKDEEERLKRMKKRDR